jgi:hypothetical protein
VLFCCNFFAEVGLQIATQSYKHTHARTHTYSVLPFCFVLCFVGFCVDHGFREGKLIRSLAQPDQHACSLIPACKRSNFGFELGFGREGRNVIKQSPEALVNCTKTGRRIVLAFWSLFSLLVFLFFFLGTLKHTSMRKVNLAEEPLLKKEDAEEQQQETTRQMGLTVAEWAVRVTMCAVFFSGVAFIAATSTHNSRETLEWLLEHLRAYPLGLTGKTQKFQSSPVSEFPHQKYPSARAAMMYSGLSKFHANVRP